MTFDLDVTWEDDGDDLAAYPDPMSARYPAIEQAALTTQRTVGTALVVAVGFDTERLDVCRAVLGEAAELVVVEDAAATKELVAVLRPRLVLAMGRAEEPDAAQLEAAVARYGARLVRCPRGASGAVVACLVRQAAEVVFSGEVGTSDRTTVPPPELQASVGESSPYLGEAWPARTGT